MFSVYTCLRIAMLNVTTMFYVMYMPYMLTIVNSALLYLLVILTPNSTLNPDVSLIKSRNFSLRLYNATACSPSSQLMFLNIKHINWSKCNNFHLSQYRAEIEKQVTKLFTIHHLGQLTPDMINSAICNIIHEAEKHLPQSKFNTYAKPYWCSELKHAHARARHFRSVWLRSGRPRGGQHLSYSDYRLAKKCFRRLQRQCIAKYENSIFDQLTKIQISNCFGSCLEDKAVLDLKFVIVCL